RALPDGLLDWITDVKSKSDLPVAVGFGISTTSQARRVAQVADGVIVGSAIIDIIQANSGRRDMIANVEKFLRQLGRSLHRGAIPSDKSK
ncbi:MAG TPA: tryptophan synthase subunit alpha, partial [Candidatus Deferrimicrobium sp.]|nr:tryptophan synthase subunit alpha [Candidatus Deferrimicrobium sp.]